MGRRAQDRWITAKEVSELTGLSLSTIYAGRCETDKLKRMELRTSPRQKRSSIRFSLLDVLAWQQARIQASTSATNRRRKASACVIDLAKFKQEKAG